MSETQAKAGTEEAESEAESEEESLLLHPTRKQIVETLREKPGLNKNQLHKQMGVGLKVLDHHLTKLLEAEIVLRLESAQGREHLYFDPEDRHLWENERTRIMFGRRATRDVGLYLVENPGCTSQEIADALDITAITVRHHLRTLRDHDIVTSASIGRRVEYHPLSELREWAETVGHAYDRSWAEDEA